MTYNFDPDRWYENELRMLDFRQKSGELNDQAYKDAVDDLIRRYEEMTARLDGSYSIPKSENQG